MLKEKDNTPLPLLTASFSKACSFIFSVDFEKDQLLQAVRI